jgi:hypothetical protein
MNDTFLPAGLGLRSKIRCNRCRWEGTALALGPIENPATRLKPGDEVPAGDCPKCGELVYAGSGHLPHHTLRGDQVGATLHIYLVTSLGATESLVATVQAITSPAPLIHFKGAVGMNAAREVVRFVQDKLQERTPDHG